MINDRESSNISQFYKAVLTLKNEEECKSFFEDVATIKELLEMSSRLEVASLLSQGVVFNEISSTTGASSATISRVNKCINYGDGGYKMVLDRIKDE